MDANGLQIKIFINVMIKENRKNYLFILIMHFVFSYSLFFCIKIFSLILFFLHFFVVWDWSSVHRVKEEMTDRLKIYNSKKKYICGHQNRIRHATVTPYNIIQLHILCT